MYVCMYVCMYVLQHLCNIKFLCIFIKDFSTIREGEGRCGKDRDTGVIEEGRCGKDRDVGVIEEGRWGLQGEVGTSGGGEGRETLV